MTVLARDEAGRPVKDLRLDDGLPPGDYILRVLAAHSMTERIERRVPFEIVK